MSLQDRFAHSVAFSPDGMLFAMCSGQTPTIRVFDSATGDEKGGFRGNRTNSIAFSPDGKRLASGDTGGLVKLWDLKLASPVEFRHRQDIPTHGGGSRPSHFTPGDG